MGSIFAQTQISGRVVSADDNTALPGVTVVVKGTTAGTVTNVNGDYSINAPQNAELVFTFVGMLTQTIKVGNRSVINVTLQSDASQLEEVVVTALGVTREKKSLGYATQDIKAENWPQMEKKNVEIESLDCPMQR